MDLIGLTGTLGAGKGTVTEYLVQEKGFFYASISEFLAAEALRRGMPPDRQSRHTVANEYRASGPTALMEAVFAFVDPRTARVVLEPQHTVAEVMFIHAQGGKVIGVDADLAVRYERIQGRGGAKDAVTFEEFAAHERMEMESTDPNRNNLRAALAHADVVISNNGSIAELHARVDEALATFGYR